MADRVRARASVRSAVVWQSVRAALDELSTRTSRQHLDVLDAGGGTGGFAVPLAVLGLLGLFPAAKLPRYGAGETAAYGRVARSKPE